MPRVYIEGTGYFIQHIANKRYNCIRDSLPLCMLFSFFAGKLYPVTLFGRRGKTMETYYDDHRKPSMKICEITETTTEITIIHHTTRTIEINNEIGTVIVEMNHDERNIIRKETRRHISLEAYDLSRDRFQTTDGTPEDILCHKEEIYALYRAINTLNNNQKKLIYRVFWLEESQYDIAREEGVSRVAIHNRLKKIFKKMKKFLENEG